MDIDLVYLYVNGSDVEWVEKRNKYAAKYNKAECRFRDNNELLYSLRSVEKFANWIRRIYIVTDGQTPDWLDITNERVKIIDHKEIMPESILPCFNSIVIEHHLHLIPGLSDFFIYANDDMFFGNYAKKSFFVENGKPIVRMTESKIILYSQYEQAMYNAQQMIKSSYGKEYDLVPTHTIDVYSKKAFEDCRLKYKKDIDDVCVNKFRKENDIERVLYQYYMIANDLCVLKTYKYNRVEKYKRIIFPTKYLDIAESNMGDFFGSIYNRICFMRKPILGCLNDAESTTEEDILKYQKYMKKLFPKKSLFER